MRLYTFDNQFIEETYGVPVNFTGIVECANGTKFWYMNGKCHRLDGPAIDYAGGSRQWYVNGKLHRLDGPACEGCDGYKQWWVNDKQVTEEQCELLHSIMKLKGLI